MTGIPDFVVSDQYGTKSFNLFSHRVKPELLDRAGASSMNVIEYPPNYLALTVMFKAGKISYLIPYSEESQLVECKIWVQERLNLTGEQTTQLLNARVTLLSKAEVIFQERRNIVSAVEVRAMVLWMSNETNFCIIGIANCFISRSWWKRVPCIVGYHPFD